MLVAGIFSDHFTGGSAGIDTIVFCMLRLNRPVSTMSPYSALTPGSCVCAHE
jgi:hypothetical protein